MSLSRNSLSDALRPFFIAATMPSGGGVEVVRNWATAYASYAQAATAGGVSPITLAPIGFPGAFFDALQSSLQAMWLSAPWAGPGLVGTTALVPPLTPILSAVGVSLLGSRSPDAALSRITDALHTYTLGITVTVVTAAGVTSIAPVI